MPAYLLIKKNPRIFLEKTFILESRTLMQLHSDKTTQKVTANMATSLSNISFHFYCAKYFSQTYIFMHLNQSFYYWIGITENCNFVFPLKVLRVLLIWLMKTITAKPMVVNHFFFHVNIYITEQRYSYRFFSLTHVALTFLNKIHMIELELKYVSYGVFV